MEGVLPFEAAKGDDFHAVLTGNIVRAKGVDVFRCREKLGLGCPGIQGCGPAAATGQEDTLLFPNHQA